MNVLKKVLVGLGIFVAILIFIGLALPSKMHVQRSIAIEAPASTVFPYVNDLKLFNQWSPWASIDPDAQYTFEGPDSGLGARMLWGSENPGVGSGVQEIVASEPNRRVEVVLDFGDQGTGSSYYELKPDGNNTIITWGFDSEFGYDLVGRYFGLLMDDMVAAEYDKGLAKLKDVVEGKNDVQQ
jgi:uncharacterized protein YndB with AHSA1/START domain